VPPKKIKTEKKSSTDKVQFSRKRSESDIRLRQADRLSRALEILKCFNDSKSLSKKELAARLECSPKTIERTFLALELAGVPVMYDPTSRSYRLQDGCIVPPLPLTMDEGLDEARAVAVGQTISGRPSPKRKLAAKPEKRVLGRGVSEMVELATALTSVLELKTVDNGSSNPLLRTIQLALAQSRRLQAEYHSPYSDQTCRLLIDPYRLCYIRGAWYLIGRPEYSDQPISWRVVRFRTLVATEEPSRVPDDFDLEQHLGNAWGVFREETCYDVAIRFWGPAAKVVTETRWHRTQVVVPNEDGTVTLQFKVSGLNEILWWLMSWAPFSRVEDPPELRERLLKELHNAIRANS
jgi:predicted DNA-binding transcriptional regulator YafY